MDTDQSRAFSSSQLRSGLVRKRKKEDVWNMTWCHFYGDVFTDRMRNVWCNCEGTAGGRSDTPARLLPVDIQPNASPSHDSYIWKEEYTEMKTYFFVPVVLY